MSRPLPEPVIFLDECLGSRDVAEGLRSLGVTVEVLVDHFASGTPDQHWLPKVGQRGWVVLTKDKWIRRRELERESLLQAGVAAFVLTAGDMTGPEQAAAFVRAHPKMRKLLRDYEVPFIASVDATGRVQLLTAPARRAAKKK